jgi:multimeric flavodoxin WrbA
MCAKFWHQGGSDMQVIAFLGSPRKDGNTSILLAEALRGVADSGHTAQTFNLAHLKIRPCLNCGGCDKTGACVVVDDEMGLVYPAIREASRIILASPIFFAGLTAQTKAMVDRCQAFWCEKYLLNRPIPAGPEGRKGLFLTVGGMKTGKGVECSGASATAFFRTVSVTEHATLGYRPIDAKGAIREHPTALAEAYEAGRALVGA